MARGVDGLRSGSARPRSGRLLQPPMMLGALPPDSSHPPAHQQVHGQRGQPAGPARAGAGDCGDGGGGGARGRAAAASLLLTRARARVAPCYLCRRCACTFPDSACTLYALLYSLRCIPFRLHSSQMNSTPLAAQPLPAACRDSLSCAPLFVTRVTALRQRLRGDGQWRNRWHRRRRAAACSASQAARCVAPSCCRQLLPDCRASIHPHRSAVTLPRTTSRLPGASGSKRSDREWALARGVNAQRAASTIWLWSSSTRTGSSFKDPRCRCGAGAGRAPLYSRIGLRMSHRHLQIANRTAAGSRLLRVACPHAAARPHAATRPPLRAGGAGRDRGACGTAAH